MVSKSCAYISPKIISRLCSCVVSKTFIPGKFSGISMSKTSKTVGTISMLLTTDSVSILGLILPAHLYIIGVRIPKS